MTRVGILVATCLSRVAMAAGPNDPDRAKLAGAALALGIGLILFLLFLVGGYALIRIGRRSREAAKHERSAPTPNEDVWAQHRLPEEDDLLFDEPNEASDP